MPRRNTALHSDEEIFAALRSLYEQVGHIPTPADVNYYRGFPLNASGMRRRFGSMYRANLLAGIWFKQPDTGRHEPLDIGQVIARSTGKDLFDTSDGLVQVLFLGFVVNPEDILRKNIEAGTPVGGAFSPVQGHGGPQYPFNLTASNYRLVDATASARGYEVLGWLCLPNGEPYRVDGQLVGAAMVVTYDLHLPHGLFTDARLAIPSVIDLGEYLRAHNSVKTPTGVGGN